MYFRRSENPKLIGGIGAVFLLLGLLILVVQWYQFNHMPSQPVPLQLSMLSEQVNHTSSKWVKLEGGHWDCESIKIKDVGQPNAETEALYVGEGNSAVYATFAGAMSCEELTGHQATGELDTINEKYLTSIKKGNPIVAQLPGTTIVYKLCGFCGPNNARAGIFTGGFLVLSSLIIILYARQEYQKRTVQIYGGGGRN